MKSKLLIIYFIGFFVAFSFHSSAIADIDAPHNTSKTMDCGNCHGEGLLQSPFWGGSMSYDELCQYCHTASSCPGTEYPEITGPFAKTHVDSDDNPLAECRTCHDPHYQKQKNYKNTDASELYLVWGTIECIAPVSLSCPYDSGSNTTTLKYLEINYKSGWDATRLREKTNPCRRTIIFPNLKKLGYNYLVEAIDEGLKTITVKGNAQPVYAYINSSSFAGMYGQYIKDTLNDRPVKFFDQTGKNSFADGDTTYNGVCEVCHTQTKYHRNDSSGDHTHYLADNCSRCHSHTDGFAHGGGGSGCDSCHGHESDWPGGPYYGTTESHSTHTENDTDDLKGPYIVCGDCHDTNNYSEFNDGKTLSATNVCDGCHSPDGSFNGIDSVGNSIGAKDYWRNAIYPDLTSKEKWCAGCHDNVPAVVGGNTAPDIVGDNTTYGYYLNVHGNGTDGVKHTGISYPKGECLHCHDVTKARTSHKVPLFADLDDPDFCMECHTDTGSVQDGGISNGPGDIETVFGKTYRHDVTAYSGIHKFSPSDETRAYLSANKHVECNDCHDPHYAKRGLHTSNEVHVSSGTNLISDSGPLAGALGVEPTWSASNWGGASSWPSTSSTATKEYQICFKCHANYNTNYASWGGVDEASWTNIALEFNPYNQSYHPVVQSLPEIDPGSNGSNRLPPSHTSLLIGDSGQGWQRTTTRIVDWRGTDPLKTWVDNQWVNWGLRIGKSDQTFSCSDQYFNPIRRIVENGVTIAAPDAPPWQKNYLEVDPPLSTIGSCYVMYSIEYYAGRGTRSGNTVTDTYKDFYLYLPSLVGYVVVISDDDGNNVAKGTVTSDTATSFTVGGWTTMYGGIPAGTVGYYFSATGQSMMCSDCHGIDTISSIAAQGPHGSAVKWMLKGRNTAWPTWRASDNGNQGGDAYTRLYEVQFRSFWDGRRDAPGATGDGLFCLNCHSTVSFSKDANGRNTAYNIHLHFNHSVSTDCISCHVTIPHGYKSPRLIGDKQDGIPARYCFDNATSNMYVYSFTKALEGPSRYVLGIYPNGYKKANCSVPGCHI